MAVTKSTAGTPCNVTSSLASGTPTPDSRAIQLYELKLLENWGPEWQSDGSICYTNQKAPAGQPELLYFISKSIPSVDSNLNLQSSMQSAKKGVHYGIRHEECIVTMGTDCNVPLYIDPIITNLMIRHPNSSFITDELVLEHVGKSLSALIMSGSTASSPKTRLAALMRGIKQITAD